MIGIYEPPQPIMRGSHAEVYLAGYTPPRLRVYPGERTWLTYQDQHPYSFPTEMIDEAPGEDAVFVTSSGVKVDVGRQKVLLRRYRELLAGIAREPREIGSRIRHITEEEWSAILAP